MLSSDLWFLKKKQLKICSMWVFYCLEFAGSNVKPQLFLKATSEKKIVWNLELRCAKINSFWKKLLKNYSLWLFYCLDFAINIVETQLVLKGHLKEENVLYFWATMYYNWCSFENAYLKFAPSEYFFCLENDWNIVKAQWFFFKISFEEQEDLGYFNV
jgi:hypothetical protein